MKFITSKLNIALFIILLTSAFNSYASDLVMVRVKQSFPETMVNLQSAIKKTGYTISRVQRVDIGLTKSGFKTDKYRVVFYGKAEEVKELVKRNHEISPFLPLKISIFAENNDTILVSNNPSVMKNYFKNIDKAVFEKWSEDLNKIFTLTNKID